MALSIKTDEADRLARELAAETHESLTEAVTVALRERLDRVRARRGIDITHRLGRLTVEYTGLPVHDPRTPDEILGYDDVGLPS
jgi:antitoxin VapB